MKYDLRHTTNCIAAANNWAKDVGMKLDFIATDSKITRRISTDHTNLTMDAYVTCPDQSDQFCREAAILLPLAGGPFDKAIEMYAGKINESTTVACPEGKTTYTIHYHPLQDLIRKAAKMDLHSMSVFNNLSHGAGTSHKALQISQAFEDFFSNAPIQPVVENALAEINIMFSAWANSGVIGGRSFAIAEHAFGVVHALVTLGVSFDQVFSDEFEFIETPLAKLALVLDEKKPNWRDSSNGVVHNDKLLMKNVGDKFANYITAAMPTVDSNQKYQSAINNLYAEIRPILLRQ